MLWRVQLPDCPAGGRGPGVPKSLTDDPEGPGCAEASFIPKQRKGKELKQHNGQIGN